MHEIAIRGGTVIDGTGTPGRRLDVGIANGRIAELAPSLRGAREIDASGRLVTPGFIDLHTHYDPQVLWDPALTPSSFQGVTSVVAGNCGYSLAPTRAEGRGCAQRWAMSRRKRLATSRSYSDAVCIHEATTPWQ